MNADQNLPNGAPTVLFSRAAVVKDSASDEARTIDFVCSTSDIDGHGTIVRQNWQLDRFNENGVVLYAHDQCELPIGTAVARVQDGKLMAKVTFSTADLNPVAEQVWLNVKAGVLRGISAGFMPHTVTFETHDDVNVMVLDENELFELSITPCPSNAGALAQMRSMHAPAPQPSPPPGGTADPTPPAEEKPTMTIKENTDPTPTISVARALGLPAGCTEQDMLVRSQRLFDLEVLVMTLTGAKDVAEASGTLRGMAGAAKDLKAATAELATVKAERDAQNFEAVIQKGVADLKLSPAEEKYERDLFAQAVADGRGEARVSELRGFLTIKAPDLRRSRDVKSPAANAGSGSPLLWNGKAYKDLGYSARAKLSREEPELWKLMKADYEDNQGRAA